MSDYESAPGLDVSLDSGVLTDHNRLKPIGSTSVSPTLSSPGAERTRRSASSK